MRQTRESESAESAQSLSPRATPDEVRMSVLRFSEEEAPLEKQVSCFGIIARVTFSLGVLATIVVFTIPLWRKTFEDRASLEDDKSWDELEAEGIVETLGNAELAFDALIADGGVEVKDTEFVKLARSGAEPLGFAWPYKVNDRVIYGKFVNNDGTLYGYFYNAYICLSKNPSPGAVEKPEYSVRYMDGSTQKTVVVSQKSADWVMRPILSYYTGQQDADGNNILQRGVLSFLDNEGHDFQLRETVGKFLGVEKNFRTSYSAHFFGHRVCKRGDYVKGGSNGTLKELLEDAETRRVIQHPNAPLGKLERLRSGIWNKLKILSYDPKILESMKNTMQDYWKPVRRSDGTFSLWS